MSRFKRQKLVLLKSDEETAGGEIHVKMIHRRSRDTVPFEGAGQKRQDTRGKNPNNLRGGGME